MSRNSIWVLARNSSLMVSFKSIVIRLTYQYVEKMQSLTLTNAPSRLTTPHSHTMVPVTMHITSHITPLLSADVKDRTLLLFVLLEDILMRINVSWTVLNKFIKQSDLAWLLVIAPNNIVQFVVLMVLPMIINALWSALVVSNKVMESALLFLRDVSTVPQSSCLLAEVMELLLEIFAN